MQDGAHLQRLLDFQSDLISAEPDLETLMQLVAQRSQALVGASGAVVELTDADDLVYRAVSGMAQGQLGLRLSREGSFSGLCVEKGEALSCSDTETDPRVNLEACRAVGLRSMVVQPLFRGDTPIGVVKVMWPQPDGFQAEAANILGQVSKSVAGVLANALRWDSMKSHNDNLSHLASHDALTGVRNRSAFYDQSRLALAHARRRGARVGIALFDLDGLKEVNDTHGHQAGDHYLRSFAQRLAGRVRETDTVARLGGDEFGVLFPVEGNVDALQLGRTWADQTEGPLTFGSAQLSLRTSAGTAVFADDGVELEVLVARADERLYEDKRRRQTRR